MAPPPSASTRAYLWLVVAAAGGLLAYAFRAPGGPLPSDVHERTLLALLAASAVLAIHFPVPIAQGQKVNVATAPYLAGLLRFGAPAAVLLVGFSQLAGGGTLALRHDPATGRRMRSVRSAVFNAAQMMLATGLAGLVYDSFLPPGPPASPQRVANLWGVAAAAVIMYLVNTGAVAAMVALQHRQSVAAVWRAGRRTDALQFAALVSIGTVIALLSPTSIWAAVLMLPPLVITQLWVKRTIQLREQAKSEAEITRKLSDSLCELNTHLEEVNRLRDRDQRKNELLAIVSHELRTPISAVRMHADTLKAQAQLVGAAAIERAAERILLRSRQLERLLRDLWEFGRVERGEVTVEPEVFDLADVLSALCAELRLRDGSERIVCALPPGVLANADPERVAQMAANLLDNALKYAPHGPIVVRAERQAEAARVVVEDQGPGVPPEEQPRVWEKFYRAGHPVGRDERRGAGIGLAVVKAFAEAQGGRVGAVSTPGRGACFWFEVPAAAAPPTPG
jgi:signal transduction histidine kinase